MFARKTLLGIAGAVTALALTGSVAVAGEVGGSGRETPIRDTSRSACAFSGLEDHPLEPGTTQNWGQTIRIAGPLGGANSVEGEDGEEEGCNAHLYPNK